MRCNTLTKVGKIKWFNNEKGYGFIECRVSNNVFVHYSSIRMYGYKTLEDGRDVRFDLVQSGRGAKAINVVRLRPLL